MAPQTPGKIEQGSSGKYVPPEHTFTCLVSKLGISDWLFNSGLCLQWDRLTTRHLRHTSTLPDSDGRLSIRTGLTSNLFGHILCAFDYLWRFAESKD